MKHYGDITKLNGAELPPVDCLVGGSPCQDLSLAGKRKGLEGERSGLFMDQIRIIKEMREHDRADGRSNELVRPRYAVWENVPGARSSGSPKGADFQAVLTEFVRVVTPEAPDVPIPADGWTATGSLTGVGADGTPFSLAWNEHDAQRWGVPQRRRRVCVLADYAGLTAPWILFDAQFERCTSDGEPYSLVTDTGELASETVFVEREGVSGDFESCGEAREGVAEGDEGSVDSQN